MPGLNSNTFPPDEEEMKAELVETQTTKKSAVLSKFLTSNTAAIPATTSQVTTVVSTNQLKSRIVIASNQLS